MAPTTAYRIERPTAEQLFINDNNNKHASETRKMMHASERMERTHADRSAQLLLGGGPADPTSQLVSSSGSDFHTLLFRRAFDLFTRALSDPCQTALVVSRLECVAPTPFHFRFGPDALRVLQEENAGGASEFSEAVSMEYFHRVFGATLLKTEMEIRYVWGRWSKKTDYSCLLDGQCYAVSVTRAMRFRGEFTELHALTLLSKKLYGVQMSNRDVANTDRWAKQVLHVLTESVTAVQCLRRAFQHLLQHEPALVGDTVVLITLCSGAPFLFFNFCADQAKMRFVDDSTPTLTPGDGFARMSEWTEGSCGSAEMRASDALMYENYLASGLESEFAPFSALPSPLLPHAKGAWEDSTGGGEIDAGELLCGYPSRHKESLEFDVLSCVLARRVDVVPLGLHRAEHDEGEIPNLWALWESEEEETAAESGWLLGSEDAEEMEEFITNFASIQSEASIKSNAAAGVLQPLPPQARIRGSLIRSHLCASPPIDSSPHGKTGDRHHELHHRRGTKRRRLLGYDMEEHPAPVAGKRKRAPSDSSDTRQQRALRQGQALPLSASMYPDSSPPSWISPPCYSLIASTHAGAMHSGFLSPFSFGSGSCQQQHGALKAASTWMMGRMFASVPQTCC